MKRRPTISAAIIALNEAKNLSELLPQLDWTDEIVVVVDGRSRDETARVAERHGCRVACRRFDDFASQRNLALRLATGDWIFSIDADERPSPALPGEIRRRVSRCSQAAFRIAVRSSIFGRRIRRSGTQDDLPVRLFRRDRAQWLGDVHEVLRVRGRVGRLDHWLTHRTIPDLHAFLSKVHRYTSLEAQRRVKAGKPPRWLDPWVAPPREVFRRLLWKQGLLDGPNGWAFCLLSGLSEWVLARRHRDLWAERTASPLARGEPVASLPSDAPIPLGTSPETRTPRSFCPS